MSRLWWFPCYNRKPFKEHISLKRITQLNMSLLLQQCFLVYEMTGLVVSGGVYKAYVKRSPLFNVTPAMHSWTGKTSASTSPGLIRCLDDWGWGRGGLNPHYHKQHFLQISKKIFFSVSWICQTPIDSFAFLCKPCLQWMFFCQKVWPNCLPLNSQCSCKRTNQWFCECFPLNVKSPEQLIE